METCRFSVNNKDDKVPTLKGMKPGLHRAVQWEQVELHLVTIQFSLACTKHHPKSWITTSSWEPLSDTKEKRGTARRLCWLWSPKRQQREHIILYAVFAWIQNTMVSLFPASLLWWWEVWRRAKVLLIYSRNIHRTRNLSMESKGIIRILSPPAIAWHMAAPLPTTSITLSLFKKKKNQFRNPVSKRKEMWSQTEALAICSCCQLPSSSHSPFLLSWSMWAHTYGPWDPSVCTKTDWNLSLCPSVLPCISWQGSEHPSQALPRLNFGRNRATSVTYRSGKQKQSIQPRLGEVLLEFFFLIKATVAYHKE